MGTTAEFWRLWHEVGERMGREMAVWVAGLRAEGVKAAHPDDGWHDRKGHRFKLMYPDFDDGVEVGDRVALGRPDRATKIVTVTTIEWSTLGGKPWYRY